MSDVVVRSEDLSAKAHFAWNFVLATFPRTSTPTIVAGFKNAFARAYGLPFEHCPRDRWKKDFDAGLEELARVRLVEVKRGAMHDWEVTAIYPDRFEGGSILLES